MFELKKGDTIDLTKKPLPFKFVYVAGKVTNLPNYREVFKEAVTKLENVGCICMNPAELPEGFPWEAYMPICYAMIDQCEAIYLLKNWKDSKGAKMEYDYAVAHGKIIIYEEMEDDTMPELSDKKQNKVDETRKILDDKGIIYKEMQYGQFQVDKANYWATTEKWHDPVRKEKGVGLNSFLTHLKKNNIIA